MDDKWKKVQEQLDGLEWVQRQAMKVIKGRKGLIYKTRLGEQYCPGLAKGQLAGGWL